MPSAHLEEVLIAGASGAAFAGGVRASGESQPARRAHSSTASARIERDRVMRRGMERGAGTIAAAGGHGLLLIGTPGQRQEHVGAAPPGLLPPLTGSEALDCAATASASSGGFRADTFGARPFRAPHHTASVVSRVGGGARAQPGEISLAYHGVSFPEEMPEFDCRALEGGIVTVSRAAVHALYPAQFQLIAAMNPCRRGLHGNPDGRCRCTPARIESDRARRTDAQTDRWCALDGAGRRLLDQARERLNLSGRSRILKLARTLADLEDRACVTASHVGEAVMLRCLDADRSTSACP